MTSLPVQTTGRFATLVGGLALFLGLTGEANARPGEHIKAGEAVITPQLDLGVEHRSNAYQMPLPEQRIPVTNLRIAPGLTVAASTPQTDFKLTGVSELRYVVSTNGNYGLVNGVDRRVNLDRFNDFNVNSEVNLLKGSALGFSLSENVGLRNNPAQTGGSAGSGSAYHSQLRNSLRGAAILKAGPAFDVNLSGNWAWDSFLIAGTRDNGYRGYSRRHTISPMLEAKWTFFPRTALVGDVSVDHHHWTNGVVLTPQPAGYTGDDLGDTLVLADSNFVKARVGLRGRVTPKLVVIGQAGYGHAWYFASADVLAQADGDAWQANTTALQGILGTVQARYELSPGNRLTVGYLKDFDDSWFTNYMAYNTMNVTLENRFGPRFGTTLGFETRFEAYRGEITRDDVLLRAKADVSYGILDFASLSGGVWWTERNSTRTNIEYDDFNIHALVNFTY